MTVCVANGCTNKPCKDLEFFSFPENEDQKERWIKVLQKPEGWEPSPDDKICSVHFVMRQVSPHPWHPDYIPSVFRRLRTKKRDKSSRARQIIEAELGLDEKPGDSSDVAGKYRKPTSFLAASDEDFATSVEEATLVKKKKGLDLSSGNGKMKLKSVDGSDIEYVDDDSVSLQSSILESHEDDSLLMEACEPRPPVKRGGPRGRPRGRGRRGAASRVLHSDATSSNVDDRQGCAQCQVYVQEIAALTEELTAKRTVADEWGIMVQDKCTLLRSEVNLYKNQLKALQDKMNTLLINEEFFKKKKHRVTMYTGLPNYSLLVTLFNLTQGAVQKDKHLYKITHFQKFILCLMRLRMNLKFKDLAYRFNIDLTKIERFFPEWIDAMHSQFSHVLLWPYDTLDCRLGVLSNTVKDNFKIIKGIVPITKFVSPEGNIRKNHKIEIVCASLMHISEMALSEHQDQLPDILVTKQEVAIDYLKFIGKYVPPVEPKYPAVQDTPKEDIKTDDKLHNQDGLESDARASPAKCGSSDVKLGTVLGQYDINDSLRLSVVTDAGPTGNVEAAASDEHCSSMETDVVAEHNHDSDVIQLPMADPLALDAESVSVATGSSSIASVLTQTGTHAILKQPLSDLTGSDNVALTFSSDVEDNLLSRNADSVGADSVEVSNAYVKMETDASSHSCDKQLDTVSTNSCVSDNNTSAVVTTLLKVEESKTPCELSASDTDDKLPVPVVSCSESADINLLHSVIESADLTASVLDGIKENDALPFATGVLCSGDIKGTSSGISSLQSESSQSIKDSAEVVSASIAAADASGACVTLSDMSLELSSNQTSSLSVPSSTSLSTTEPNGSGAVMEVSVSSFLNTFTSTVPSSLSSGLLSASEVLPPATATLPHDLVFSSTDVPAVAADLLSELMGSAGTADDGGGVADQLLQAAVMAEEEGVNSITAGLTDEPSVDNSFSCTSLEKLHLECQSVHEELIEHVELLTSQLPYNTKLVTFGQMQDLTKQGSLHTQDITVHEEMVPYCLQCWIVLTKLRLDLDDQDLAFSYNVSLQNVQNIWCDWIKLFSRIASEENVSDSWLTDELIMKEFAYLKNKSNDDLKSALEVCHLIDIKSKIPMSSLSDQDLIYSSSFSDVWGSVSPLQSAAQLHDKLSSALQQLQQVLQQRPELTEQRLQTSGDSFVLHYTGFSDYDALHDVCVSLLPGPDLHVAKSARLSSFSQLMCVLLRLVRNLSNREIVLRVPQPACEDSIETVCSGAQQFEPNIDALISAWLPWIHSRFMLFVTWPEVHDEGQRFLSELRDRYLYLKHVDSHLRLQAEAVCTALYNAGHHLYCITSEEEQDWDQDELVDWLF